MFRVFVLLLMQLIVVAQSEKLNYAQILQGERVGDRLRLIEPTVLLRDYKEDNLIADTNRACARDLKLYSTAIDRRESWALRMLDASSTVPPGLLKGNIIELGVFDECMEAESDSSATGVDIRGRHCMYTIGPMNPKLYVIPVNPTLSICVPRSCDAEDVALLVNMTIKEHESKGLGLSLSSNSCARIDEKVFDTGFYISAAFIIVCTGFVVSCTIYDLVKQRFGDDKPGTLARFSMIKGAEKILSTEVREGDLPILHGLRVISTALVVILHEYFLQFFAANTNMADINTWFTSWFSMLPLISLYSVDTFFVLTGFLMTYTFFKKMQKDKAFNVLFHYAHRYIRLTLPVVAVVAANFVISSLPFSGALYEWLEKLCVTGCRTKWWSVITYTQNFVEADNLCLQHLWFLSVDMQLFLISPLILYPLYKKPKLGMTILTLLCLASVAAIASITASNKYSAIYFLNQPSVDLILKSFKEVYIMPYTRALPWLIGILFGYKVSCDKEKPTKMKIYLGWLLALLAFAFCIFGTRSFTDIDYDYNLIWETTFAALVKPAWAFGICWIIYASIHNFAGPITSFLSWKGFMPLSKISYCVYLVHLVSPFFRVATGRTSTYFNDYLILHGYVGDMVISTVVAFFTSLTFEMPMLIIDSMIFKGKKESINERPFTSHKTDTKKDGLEGAQSNDNLTCTTNDAKETNICT